MSTSITDTAEQVLGEAPRQKRDTWYDDECRDKAKERREAELASKDERLRTRAQKREAEILYQQVNRETKIFFRQKKREHMRRFVEQIQTASDEKDPRVMYRRVREIKGGYKQ
jgi:hypothetical protein